ncbi:carbohydrate ABC transporter permease [Paenibacillus endoradicis]|uniref:carbohydrate ABC transporter permease n=1 Tax=Paenibacillus endoradicis TaxID=2972487 RepID=UPI0021596953|nr:carbohydrate ABC transporter permease [Paenibacillus endoradicis]MCR8655794.1 carbohydrate ABC transporter permease [Paenibacillus endoradicis]MCR8658120.1 carbohydrate ABC transporter permease [Paenibacillus endoradicis]
MIGNKITLSKLFIGAILSLLTLTMFVPIVNMFARAFSSPDRVHLLQGYEILPRGFSLIHFQVVLQNPIVSQALINSLFITIVGTVSSIFLTTVTAYVLTRKNLVGKTPIMVFLIIIMIFEPGIIQEYMVMKDIALLDNLWAMVVYRLVNVYYLIIMMRFIEDIPESLIEAAKIDGAGHMKLFMRIVLPLARVPLMTIGMFYAVVKWNEFFKSSIFLSSKENTVLQVMLRQFIVERDTSTLVGAAELLKNSSVAQLDFSALKAATIVIAIVPILMLYPIILKHYTGGVMEGGVKE